MLQEGIASFGAAVEGWGRQKGEDALRQQKLEALLESLMVEGKQTSVINQEELARAEATDKLATEARNDYDRERFEFEKEHAAGLHQASITQNEQARAKAYDALGRVQSEARPSFLNDEGFFNFRNDVANEASDLTEQGLPLSLLQKNMGGRIDPTTGLVYTEDKLGHLVGLALEANKQMDLSTTQHGLVEENLGARDVDMKQRLDAFNAKTKALPPITSAVDYFNANQDKFTTLESEPAELDPRVLEVLGPKLLAKAKSGNMNRGDILVANEKLENLLLEQRAARSPEGRLRQLQIAGAEDQLARGRRQDQQKVAWGDMIQRLGGMGSERRLASQTVTPEFLMQQVQSDKMTAAEAIQREEAIVDHMRGKGTRTGMPGLPRGEHFNFGDERGAHPYASGAELTALQNRKKIPKGQDMLYGDAWKHNSAFQRKHAGLTDEQKAFKWHMGGEASKYTRNPDAPSISLQEHMDRFAPPQEMQQNFERALTGAESREQALAWVEQDAGKLGQAGYAAALAHVDRQFPAEITTEVVGNQVLIRQGNKVLGLSTMAAIQSNVLQHLKNPDGSLSGTSMTSDRKPIKTPDHIMETDPAYVKTLPEYVDMTGLHGVSYQGKAQTKEEAVALRERYSTALEVIPMIDKLLLMTGMDDPVLSGISGRSAEDIAKERAGFVEKYGTAYSPEGETETYGSLRAAADGLVVLLVGKLRVPITGPGAMTEQEVKRIEKILANPFAAGKKDRTNQNALMEARGLIIRSIDAFAQTQGIERVNTQATDAAPPLVPPGGVPTTQQPPARSFDQSDIDAILERRKK
jgi:hypothetical protein